MAYVLLSPLTFALLVGFGLCLAWRYLPRWGRCTGLLAEALLLLLMTPLVANALVGLIESRASTARTCRMSGPATIVVLSGGLVHAPRTVRDFSSLGLGSMRRLFAGVELWRRTPGARLVIAGGSQYAVPVSTVLAALARDLGVPSDAIRTETRSLTTWENAMELAAMRPVLPSHVWLVSSALHLPRARIAFRAAGFHACLVPSDRQRMPFQGPGDLWPQADGLDKSEAAIHELVGILLYRIRAHGRERVPS